jgi:protein SCO1
MAGGRSADGLAPILNRFRKPKPGSLGIFSAMKFAALVLAALAVVLGSTACGGDSDSAGTSTAEGSNFAGGELKPPSPTPDFTLHDQSGQEVSIGAQRGKLVVLTFLYTNCPDVCPLIAENLNRGLRQLGSKRGEVRVLAVSVDPEGDTPKSVRAFVKAHHLVPEFHYLTGSRAELMKIWKAYNVAAVARDPELVDHTAYTMLVDRSGKGRVIYDSGVTTADVVHDITALLGA